MDTERLRFGRVIPGASRLSNVKTLTIILLLAAFSGAAFARSPNPIPARLAQKMRATTANLVFDDLNSLKDDPDPKDLEAFEFAADKLPIYLEKGSIADTRPDLLIEELTAYCNTPENPFVTLFIVFLCRNYKKFYDSYPENVALHEQFLGIQAAAVDEGRDRFFAANPAHKERPKANPLVASLGSGFVISPDGYILTNNHVIAQSTRILIIVRGHEPLEAPVILSDPYKDLALLKLPLGDFPYLPIADSDLVQVLDTVYVLGYPLASVLGSAISASEGKINAIRNEGQIKLFQFDADVNPGNSGGPLLNDKGEVIGVVVGKLDARKMLEEHGSLPERVNFAIPINDARQMLRKAYTRTFTNSARRDVFSASKIFDDSKGATVLITATSSRQ